MKTKSFLFFCVGAAVGALAAAVPFCMRLGDLDRQLAEAGNALSAMKTVAPVHSMPARRELWPEADFEGLPEPYGSDGGDAVEEEAAAAPVKVSDQPELASPPAAPRRREPPSEEQMREWFSEMNRRNQERAKMNTLEFAERIGCGEDQQEKIFAISDEMNMRVSEIAASWAEYLREQGRFSQECRLRIMYDISAAVVDAYDNLDKVLPDGWREDQGGWDVGSLIDWSGLGPLMDVERELGGGRSMRGMMGTFSGGRGRR